MLSTTVRGITALTLCATALLLSTPAVAGGAVPTFSKIFTPTAIGPGSVSTLRFDVTNSDPVNPVDNLAFTDTLPAGVTIATPAAASSTCGGIVTAPDGGSTITFSGGMIGVAVGLGTTCSVFVNVTSGAVGTHMNVSGDLTSDAGNSGPATADLTVAADRPGFMKSFSPNPVSLGGRSTLTFTVDNTANASQMNTLQFTDALPAGMVVADPANVSNTCNPGAFTGGVVTAVPGTNVVSLTGVFASTASAAVDPGATCTISVDVIGVGVGLLGNVTGDLTSVVGFTTRNSGKAGAVLEVTADPIALTKDFTDDPVPPGGTVTLEFTITNRDRNNSAVNVAFSDNLGATLAGLVATGLPASDVCGAGSLLAGTGVISLTGGDLPAQGSCTFSVTLQVPVAAVPGAYPNTTSTVTADVGGSPTVGSPAAETLFVASVPLLTKTFLDNPVSAGASTRLEFTITNPSPTSTATDITFIDELTTFLPFPVSVTLPATPCNAGSSITLVPLGIGSQGLLLAGGNLGAGLSCTFEVLVDIPLGQAPGIFTNTTSDVTATVDGATAVGNPASDDLQVVAAPSLSKVFTDDPVAPGGTVTLEFTLENSIASPTDATGIGFTDDLNAVVTGLSAVGLPANDVCGLGSQISGTTSLTFSGGTLAPGASCSFSVTLQVPAAAPTGFFTNTTSNVTATVSGLAVMGNPGSDDLVVSGLTFTKSFTNDPVIPGGSVTLEFTIDNVGTLDVTGMAFTDNLGAVVSGTTVTGPPLVDPCGAGSSLALIGSNFLTFAGGNLLAGTSCTFSVTVNVPAATASGTYPNVTSILTTSIGNLPPAVDSLVVNGDLLLLTKTFTDDPVDPGATVTLEFTLQNLHPTQTASAVTFTDDLGAVVAGLAATGLPANDVCGAGSQIDGTNVLTLTGGNLPAGASCTFSVSLAVPASAPPGATLTNTTSGVTGTITGLPVTGDPASDDLLISSLVDFSKTFDAPVFPGGTATLSFTIGNPSSVAVSSLAFTDDVGAVVAGLAATGLPAAGVCGAGSLVSGTTFLTFSGGSLAPFASCTIDVTVQVPAGAPAGTFLNTTSDLFAGGVMVAGPATAGLTIGTPPLFSKSFAPAVVGIGGVSTLTFTIDNSANGIDAVNLDFTDVLPAGTEVANPAGATVGCTGGALTAVPGSGTVSYSGGTVAAGGPCTLSVDVVATAVGAHVNTTGALTSSAGSSGTAMATLTVVSDLVLAKTFDGPVFPGGTAVLSFTIDNLSSFAASGLALTDDLGAVVAGLAATGLPAADVCGVGSSVVGTTSITFSGGSLAPLSSCTIDVTVQVPAGATPGTYLNTTSDLLAGPGSAIVAAPATANLTIGSPPLFSKSFVPAAVGLGGVSILTFTIDNSANGIDAVNLDFTDNLPAGTEVANPAGATVGCTGGTLTAVPGSGTVSYSGGTVAAGGSCTLSVDVVGTAAGSHVNTTGDLTSNAGSSGPATATLTVVSDLVLAKTFLTGPTLPGGDVALQFTVSNASAQPITSIAFTDDLGAALPGLAAVGLPAADVCGAGSMLTGTSVLTMTGGSLGAGTSCTFQVTVRLPPSVVAGSYTNVTSAATGLAGAAPIGGSAAMADLVVAFITFTKTFGAGGGAGTEIPLTFTLTNPDPVNAADGLAFTDDLDAVLPGLEAVGLPAGDVCGLGSQVSGTSIVVLTGGVLGPGASCSFDVLVRIPDGASLGTFTNVTSPLDGTVNGSPVSGGPASAATADLNIVASVVIPTLGTWGFLLLGGLLALFGVRRLRRR